MRTVEVDARVPRASGLRVFQHVIDFGRYSALSPHVKSAEVLSPRPDRTGSSSWELYFRSGLLSWREREVFRPDLLRVEFEQADGDFETLRGQWRLREQDGGCAVRFEVFFDFGMPSLESILDPIAERVIAETVSGVLTGGFPGTVVQPRAAAATGPARAALPLTEPVPAVAGEPRKAG
jgi:ribosome-associated toxin RatA of RatAB toxin-antitoxin module